MAVNTYDEGFGDVIKNNLKTFIIIGVIVLAIIGLFVGARFFTNRSDSTSEVDASGLIREHNFSTGPEDSSIKLIHIFDLGCSACRANNPAITQINEEFEDSVEIVYKSFPLPVSSFSETAAYATIAAGEQGQYFEYKERVYALQDQLSNDTFEQIAQELGLDMDTFNQRRNSKEVRDLVDSDVSDLRDATLPESSHGSGTAISAVPSNIILKNGEVVDWWGGGESFEVTKSRIEAFL